MKSRLLIVFVILTNSLWAAPKKFLVPDPTSLTQIIEAKCQTDPVERTGTCTVAYLYFTRSRVVSSIPYEQEVVFTPGKWDGTVIYRPKDCQLASKWGGWWKCDGVSWRMAK